MRDVKMPQFVIYCDLDINDSHIKERSVEVLLCACKVSVQPWIYQFLLCYKIHISKQNSQRRTVGVLKLIVTAVAAIHE